MPPLKTVREQKSSRGGNPDVYKAVSDGKTQHMAWAYDRPDGGRGFGFTGMHLHKNHGNDSFRTCLLNGAAWVAGLEVPKDGVPSKTPSEEDLKKLIEEAIAAVKEGR